jgi:hypothetical protein
MRWASVLEQKVLVDRMHAGELGRLVVDHRKGGVLRRQQVIADRVSDREAGHQGCTHEP